MLDETNDRERITNYLLGQATDEVCREIEEKLLTDDDFYEFFLTIENDLHEKYLAGEFSAAENEAFEKHFLAHPERKQDLWLTQALQEKAAAEKSTSDARIVNDPAPERFDLRRLLRVLVPAFGAILLIAGGFYWWDVSRNSYLNDGLAALKDAYKSERPVQSRLSDFDYAPFPQTRGAAGKESDDLKLAGLNLLQAVKKSPGAASYNALGLFYLGSRDFAKAIDNFNEALRFEPANPKINNNLGVAWLEKGKVESAADKGKAAISFGESLKYFNQSIALNNNLPEAIFNRAETYQNLFLPEKAVEDLQNYLRLDPASRWADEARARLKTLEEQKAKASLNRDQLIEKFRSAYQNKDADQAWQMIRLARSRTGNFILQNLTGELLGNPPGSEKFNNDLATMRFAAEVEKTNAGDFFSADLVDYYAKLTPERQEMMLRAKEIRQNAQTEYLASHYQPAAELYAEAKRILTDAGNSSEALSAELWISFCRMRVPENEGRDEIAAFNRLNIIFESKKYRSLAAQTFNGLGDVLSSIGSQSESLKARERSLEIAKRIQDREMIIRNFNSAASRNLSNGKYRLSLENALLSIELQNEFQISPTIFWPPYFLSAESFFSEGLRDAAFAYQEKSLQLAEESQIPLYRSRAATQRALFFFLTNDYENAVKFGELAFSIGKQTTDEKTRLNIESLVSILLGDIYRKAGNHQKSLDYYQKSEDIYKAIDFRAELYKIYRGKALSYIALGRDDEARKELNESIEQYEFYRNQIYEESSKNRFFDVEQGIYDVAVDFARNRLRDDRLALDYAEKSRARSLLNLTQTRQIVIERNDILLKTMSEPQSFAQLQNRLPETAQILEYAFLEEKIIAWIISKNSIQTTETPVSQTDLATKIKRYAHLLQTGEEADEAELKALAREFYQILIGPNENLLDRQKSLFIVPDKELNFLPFASLVNPETGRYLIENYPIGIAPSLNIFVLNSEKAREKAALSPEKILAVGNPFFNREKHPDLEYLPAASREVETISPLYEVRKMLVEPNAVKPAVIAEMPTAEIIHFASHAVTNEENPLSSSLILAGSDAPDGDTLTGETIYKLKLPKTKLVVLSACRTGVEQAFRGEGAIGLARPFIALGVPAVVASLWKVDSDPTAELMIRFHNLRKKENLTTIAALQKAQLEMLNGENRSFRHPRAWASFILIGGETGY